MDGDNESTSGPMTTEPVRHARMSSSDQEVASHVAVALDPLTTKPTDSCRKSMHRLPEKEDLNEVSLQAWTWFSRRRHTSTSSSSSQQQQQQVTPQLVASQLKLTSLASSKEIHQPLLPSASVALSILERCRSFCKPTNQEDDKDTSQKSQTPITSNDSKSMSTSIRVALRLLRAPTGYEIPWETVTLLLHILATITMGVSSADPTSRSTQNQDSRDSNPTSYTTAVRIVLEVQAFWSETMADWTEVASAPETPLSSRVSTSLLSPNVNNGKSQPPKTPADYIRDWVPLMLRLHQQQTQTPYLPVDANSQGLQLVESLFLVLSQVETNLDWILDGLFFLVASVEDDQLRVETIRNLQSSGNGNHPGYHQEWILSLACTLAPWMRASDWNVCVQSWMKLSAREADLKEEMRPKRSDQRIQAHLYHFVLCLLHVHALDENNDNGVAFRESLEQNLWNAMVRQGHGTLRPHVYRQHAVSAVKRACRRSNAMNGLDACLDHWMNLLLTVQRGLIAVASNQHQPQDPFEAPSQGELPLDGAMDLAEAPNDAENDSHHLATLDWLFVLSSVLETNAQLIHPTFNSAPTRRDSGCHSWRAVWNFFESISDDSSHSDLRPHALPETDDLVHASTLDPCEWLENFVEHRRVLFFGEGSFGQDIVDSEHNSTDEPMVERMTRIGRFVAKSFSKETTSESSEGSGDNHGFWLELLDPRILSFVLDQQHQHVRRSAQVWIVLSALVTALVELPAAFRVTWCNRFHMFLRHPATSPQDINDNAGPVSPRLVTVLGWTSLYMTNVFLAQQMSLKDTNRQTFCQGKEKEYEDCLVRFMTPCPEMSPSHHLVRSLLPWPNLRPILLKKAQAEWFSECPTSMLLTSQSMDKFLSPIWWGGEDCDNKEVALWTLVQLVVYEEADKDRGLSQDSTRYSDSWYPLLEFIMTGLPPVLVPLRSWFWEQALDIDFVPDCPQLNSTDKNAVGKKVRDRIMRALLIRFLQFTEHQTPSGTEEDTAPSIHHSNKKRTSGVSSYCSLSLDRIFVSSARKGQLAAPTEDLATLFFRVVHLHSFSSRAPVPKKPPITLLWIEELVHLLGVAQLFSLSNNDNATNSAPSRPITSTSGEEFTERSILLCARIVIHFIAGTCGVEEKCSLTHLRKSICGNGHNRLDATMIQLNAKAQKHLTKGEIPAENIEFLQSRLRHHLADGLVHLLLSLPNGPGPDLVVASVCALVALQQRLHGNIREHGQGPRQHESRQDATFPEASDDAWPVSVGFQDTGARDIRFLSQIFPKYIGVCLPILSSIIDGSNSDGILTRYPDTTISERRQLLLKRTNLIVRSIVYFCKEAQSFLRGFMDTSHSAKDWNTPGFRESLVGLYKLFCTKKSLGVFFVLLEQCVEPTKKRSMSLGEDSAKDRAPTEKSWYDLLLGLESSAEIDRVCRHLRQIVLCTIQSFLQGIAEGVSSGENIGDPSFYDFSNFVLLQSGHDLREGLRGDSGGLSIEEYWSFLESIEAACDCFMSIVDSFPPTLVRSMKQLVETCISVSKQAEDIVCSIAIRNRSILKRTLNLYHQTLPEIVERIIRRLGTFSTSSGETGIVMDLYDEFAKQRLHTFNQCCTILSSWSKSMDESPPVAWVDVVDPAHMEAQQKLGDVDADSDSSDGDMRNSERRPGSNFERQTSRSSHKQRKTKQKREKVLQLESSRPWTWTFCFVLDAYGALMDDSFKEMTSGEAPPLRAGVVRRIPFFRVDRIEMYTDHRLKVIREVLQGCEELLSGGTSVASSSKNISCKTDTLLAQLLPRSTKSMFRFTVEKSLRALVRAVNVLITELKTIQSGNVRNKDENMYSSFVVTEALSCVLAWIHSPVVESINWAPHDICIGVRLWLCSEYRTEAPSMLNRDNAKILLSDKGEHNKQGSMAKKLEKAVGLANDAEHGLEGLHELLKERDQRMEQELQFWNDQVSKFKCNGPTETENKKLSFERAVEMKIQQINSQKSLYVDEFQKTSLPVNQRRRKSIHSNGQGAKGVAKGSRKRRVPLSSSIVSASANGKPTIMPKSRVVTRGSHASTTGNTSEFHKIQSRNSLVQSWMEMDRETGRDESFQEDAYADLEDFLVED